MNTKNRKIFIAPQNSVIEGFQIPRYTTNPFTKERNSAPPTVTATPCNSYHNLIKNEKEKNLKAKLDYDLEEQEPRIFKTGISVLNDLQSKLCEYPQDSSILQRKLKIEERNYNESSVKETSVNVKNIEETRVNQSQQSILDIIKDLFDRLNWPSCGIIDGEIPQNNSEQNASLDDDGDFVYCIPLRCNPYNLVKVAPSKIKNYNVYYTVSASFITRVSKKDGAELTPTLEWLRERKKYYMIYQIPVFKNFRIWKSFTTWKNISINKKNIENREGIGDSLFVACTTFQMSLVEIKAKCLSITTSSNEDYMSLIKFDLFHTYDLNEFLGLQLKQCEKVEQKLTEFRQSLILFLVGVCENFYQQKYKEIEEHIKTIETQELHQIVQKKITMKNSKNFQIIKEKYNIREIQPPKEPALVVAERKMKPFKYIKMSLVKNIHLRLYRYIRLVDFIVMDMLRSLVFNSIDILQCQVKASHDKDLQPNLKGISPFVDEVLGVTGKMTLPLLKTSLFLQTNQVHTSNNFTQVLQPSQETFKTALQSIICKFESIVNTFPSLLNEGSLSKFVEIPSSTPSGESISLSDEIGKWPCKKLLFEEDPHYQGCVTDIFEKVDHEFKSINSYIKQFDVFGNMISTAKFKDIAKSLEKEWTVDQFASVLEQFTDQVTAMECMPTEERKGLFLVKTDEFKQTCLPYPKDIIVLVNKNLSNAATRKNESFLKIIRNAERILDVDAKNVEEFVDHLKFLSQISDDIPRLEKEFNLISKLFFVATQYCSYLTEEEKALFKTLRPSFQQLKSLVMYCEAKKDEKILKFSKDLDNIVDGFMKKLHHLANQIKNPSFLEADASYDVLETITYLKEELQELIEKAKSFANYEESFSNALSNSKKKQQPMFSVFAPQPSSKIVDLQNDLIDVEKDLMLRQLLWQSLREWNDLHSKWIATSFSILDVNLLQKEVTRFVQTIYLMEKGLPPNSLVPSLKKKIMMFKYAMPVVRSLRNPALKDRHWVELTNLIGVHIKGDKHLTLGRLLELHMFEHQDTISEISSQASNEATLEQMLQKIKDYWKKTDFHLIAHSRDVAIITDVDDVMAALDDSMVIISNIRGSRFHLPLQAQVNEWDRKLNLFLRTFEEWILVQRNWLYLETVFSAQDIQRQLPQEAKLFSQVDKNWRDIMRRTTDRPNALTAATTAGLIDILQGCNSTLEKIHHSLEDYLETKRLVFSRFYFLSNNELLDILANSKNVQCIQPYLSKCFANIKRLKFDLTQRPPFPICAMLSEEGEYVELSKSLKARGQVEQWLCNVESSMFDCIRMNLKKSVPKLLSNSFIQWAQNEYGQIALTTVQVHFTSQVELAFSIKDQNTKAHLQNILEQLKEKLKELSNVIKDTMSEDKRNVMVALMIFLVHQRDTVDHLIQSNIEYRGNFQWIKHLRYYWNDKLNNCFVEQSIASFTYGYEYLGCTSRLIITPLTDRCYLTLTGALHFHLGGAPTGPAGTGKSESVKDLAKAMGKQCIVFNCSEGIDFKVIGRLLSGLAQSGSWCCLDEFNRIDREVLSVIAQQIHIIRSAKMSSSVRFMFEGRDIRLISTCGIFITMNPGYTGRVELPDNLKSMFRPVSMVKPDNKLIAEIVLLSNGFSSAAFLSEKLVNIYDLSNRQLSKQSHYDFGLRTIKAVLYMAGERNRSWKSETPDKIVERKILMKAIEDSVYPKLIADDLKLFQTILEDIFPNHTQVVGEPTKLEKSIGIALRELSLQRWPSQVQKIVQLNSILNVRHGVMLVGPTAGGKTTVRNLLRHALYVHEGVLKNDDDGIHKEVSKSQVVSMVNINPKALTLGELYGEFDTNTAEWTDGILSYTVRNFILQNTDNPAEAKEESEVSKANEELKSFNSDRSFVKSKHQWIVFDGPVDTLWVENLNTMLDETRVLCLANGERISMLQSMKVIFEVDSLTNASPATISRCGMLYLDPVELGWQPTVKSWLNKLRSMKVREEERNFLWDLFEKTIDSGIEFLKEHEEQRFFQVPILSIVQMLCGFLEAFLQHMIKNAILYTDEENNSSDENMTKTEESNAFFDFSSHMLNYSTKPTTSRRRKSYAVQDPKNRKPFLLKLFAFSYIWAFGGHFSCVDEEAEDIDKYCHIPSFTLGDSVDIRHLFDSFVRNLFEHHFVIHFPSGMHLIYSYYVDFDKGQFLLWDHLVLNATMNSENELTDRIGQRMKNPVPTPSTICYSFLISLLALQGKHVMLGGSKGVGKTTLIKDVFTRLEKPGGAGMSPNTILGSVFLPEFSKMDGLGMAIQDIFPRKSFQDSDECVLTTSLAFSALTTTWKPKQILQSKLMKRGRDAFGTPHGEKVLVFLDDLTMPHADSFGTQPPLEVVREFLNYGGFYETKELHWKTVYNTTLVAACPSKKESIKENERLFQKFSTLCLPRPSAQALHHIFYTQLGRVIDAKEFTPEVVSLRSPVIAAVLGIYHNLSQTLKTTPAKSHYMFNIRDISKVVTGLLQASPNVIRTKDHFIELLINETSRVFLDRLITIEDINVFHSILLDQIHDFLKIKWSRDRLHTNSGMFGDFIELNVIREKRTYQCIRDKDKLQSIIEEYYDRAKLSGRRFSDTFVLFPEICQQITSAARVLRQPGGHLLMIGIGGTGKKAVIEIASYMQFCDFFHPIVSKNYNLNDFKEDIREVMIRAGVEGMKIVFFINDRNILQESFLELVCNVISGSDISVLFDNETKENIILKLKEEATVQGTEDSPDGVFTFFKERVRQNLHLVYATSPSGNMFHKRCRSYPDLVNNCTINWYSKWPSHALNIVAKTFLDNGVELPSSTAAPMPDCFFSILVFTHTFIEDLCKRFYTEFQRYYHVTPKSFLDFIFLFKKIFMEKREECSFRLDRLTAGLSKLEETNQMVVEMQDELISLGPLLEQKKIATRELVNEIERDQEQVNKVRAVVKKEQEITDAETRKVAAIALEAQKDLDAALPQLEAAKLALDTLNKYDIGEIRSYAKPPIMVMTVLSAVCVILNEKPDWQTAKLLLSDPGFLKKLINYNHNDVSDKVFNRLKKYTKRSDFNPITVGKISVACKSMCAWVLALEHYAAVSQMVRPKQEKCKEAQNALEDAQIKLKAKEASLSKVENQLHALEERYEESLQQLNAIKSNKNLTVKRLERASMMINILTSEKDRWSQSIEQFESESNCTMFEAFMLSASTSYLGPFPQSYRSLFHSTLVEKMKNTEVKIDENFNIMRETNPNQVQDWFNTGLPHDNHSIENALFMLNSHNWPFIIDPQHQAFKWIKKKESKSILKIVEASDKNLLQILETSIRLGEVVVIQNATSTLDSCLDPVLTKSVSKRGIQPTLVLGDSEIEYNESFRLYIFTNNPNPQLLPELCIKVLVVNFIVTMDGITDQILSKIVEQENPELESQRNKILKALVKEKSRLTELEDVCLNLLHNSRGNVLDDEELIETLFQSKTTAEEIKERVVTSEHAEKELATQREIYLPLAKRGALLFFVAEDLIYLNSIYQFSLVWFLDMFCKCISIPHKERKRRPASAKRRLSEAVRYASCSNVQRRQMSLVYSMESTEQSEVTLTLLKLVTETFYRLVSYALFAEHQLLFSFYLATRIVNSKDKLHTDAQNEEEDETQDYQILLHELQADKNQVRSPLKRGPLDGSSHSLSKRQLEELDNLSNLSSCFTGIQNYVTLNNDFWDTLMNSEEPFQFLKERQKTEESSKDSSYFNLKKLSSFHLLAIVKLTRPDKFLASVTSYVSLSLGPQYVTPSTFNLQDFYNESNCRTPLMFILSPGSDPSSHLLRFVKDIRGSTLHLDMISLGRSQGTKAANAIRRAYSQKGSWVFLQNCHLAISFMPQLEEILRELSDLDTSVNQHFRLWLSSKPDPLLPTSVLQASMKMTVESPPGVKRNLQNLFTSNGGAVNEHMFEDTSVHLHWKKLLFSACLFHVALQERKRFGSFGWNTPYEFITPDLEASILTLKDVISNTKEIPWQALQTLTGEIIYGGRVTNPWDKRCLQTLLKKFYCEELLDENFSYFNTECYKAPSHSCSFEECIGVIENFPTTDFPEIIGMNENVVYNHNKEETKKLMENLTLLNTRSTIFIGSANSSEDFIVRRAENILKLLPDSIVLNKAYSKTNQYNCATLASAHTLHESKGNSGSSLMCAAPMLSVLQQERRRFDNLLSVVTSSLRDVCGAFLGDMLFNNQLEDLAKSLSQNKVPKLWQKHSFHSNKNLSSWVKNLKMRIDFLTRWLDSAMSNDVSMLPRAIWLPAFFYPQGILTAALQSHSRALGCSVDLLRFQHEVTTRCWHEDVDSDGEISPNNIAFQGGCSVVKRCITVFGLYLDGASWDHDNHAITRCTIGERVCPLPEIDFIPVQINKITRQREDSISTYLCPLYQTSRRQEDNTSSSDYITSIELPTLTISEVWVLSGVAALCQTDE